MDNTYCRLQLITLSLTVIAYPALAGQLTTKETDSPKRAALRRLAEQGDVLAQTMLGDSLRCGDAALRVLSRTTERCDSREAAIWLRIAADRGDSLAQTYLGNLYKLGEGVLQDHEAAAMWYRKSAEQNGDGAFHLGLCYRDGIGVQRDLIEAHKWLNIANVQAQGGGDMYRQTVAEALKGVETQMSQAQLTTAQRRARMWLEAYRRKAQ